MFISKNFENLDLDLAQILKTDRRIVIKNLVRFEIFEILTDKHASISKTTKCFELIFAGFRDLLIQIMHSKNGDY